MGRIYRRHSEGNYYGDFTTPEGKRVQRSLGTKDRVVAKERLRLAELGATPDSRGKKQRLMDAIDEMIRSMHNRAEATKEMYREKGRRLLKSLGNPFVSDISLAMLDRYILLRSSSDPEHGGASKHTIQKELITVRRALKYAIRTKALHVMPTWPEFSAEYEPRKVWLTPSEFERVCAELEPKRQLWASLAALGGMRASEVERLEWAHLAERLMHVPGTKTERSARPVPVAPALLHRLDQVPADQRTGRVVERWGNVRRDLHAACDRAGVKRVSPNDLRRTFASWLVQQGVPLLTVAALLGHSTTRMLEKVYGRLSQENLESAIGALPALGGVTHGVTDTWGDAGDRGASRDKNRGRRKRHSTDEKPSDSE